MGIRCSASSFGVPKHPYEFNCSDPDPEDPNNPLQCSPDDPTDLDVCRCDHVDTANRLHCLQSSEATTSANVEGYAHFIAARIWNNEAHSDCKYNYYKEFKEGPNQEFDPPYEVDCRTAVRWRDNNCFKSARGTEYDWLQFLWNVNTVSTNKISLDGIRAIHEEACNGGCSDVNVSWSLLRQAAQDHYGSIGNPQYVHFNQSGDNFGVDEDQ